MFGLGLKPHEIDDVHDAHAHFGQPFPQNGRGSDGLERRHVTAAGEHDIRLRPLVVGRPVPDADPAGAMQNGVVHREELQRRLFSGDDDVDVVAAAQAVVGHRQQRVGVRRQVDADDLRLLVGDVVDEAGILVRKAVVVLPPDVRAEQIVERRDRPPPGNPARDLQPFRVLIEHRVHDVDESLVAVEEAVPAGEQIALEPPLTHVLGKNLHDAPVRPQTFIGRFDLGLPPARRHREDVA
jgi:hypothetical protein